MDGIPLSDAISDLRKQLTLALESQEGDIRFGVNEIELNLDISVNNSGGGKAGVHLWFIQASGQGEHSRSMTHHLRLSLRPVRADGSEVLLSDSDSD